jgi:hypothetical protein
MVERLNVRQAARKNHLLMNTFLIGWFIGFDEGKKPDVTGMVKNIFECEELIALKIINKKKFFRPKSPL